MSENTPQPQFISRRELRERQAAQAAAQQALAGQAQQGGATPAQEPQVPQGELPQTRARRHQVPQNQVAQAPVWSPSEVVPETPPEPDIPAAPVWQPVQAPTTEQQTPDFLQAHRMATQRQSLPALEPLQPEQAVQPEQSVQPEQPFQPHQDGPAQPAPVAGLSRRQLRELREHQEQSHVAPRPGAEDAAQWANEPQQPQNLNDTQQPPSTQGRGQPQGQQFPQQPQFSPADEQAPRVNVPKAATHVRGLDQETGELTALRPQLDELLQRAEQAERRAAGGNQPDHQGGADAAAHIFAGLNGRGPQQPPAGGPSGGQQPTPGFQQPQNFQPQGPQPGFAPQGVPHQNFPQQNQPPIQQAQPQQGAWPLAAGPGAHPGQTGDFAGSFPPASAQDVPQVAQLDPFDVDEEDLHGHSFDWKHIVGLVLVAAIIGVLVWLMIDRNTQTSGEGPRSWSAPIAEYQTDHQQGALW